MNNQTLLDPTRVEANPHLATATPTVLNTVEAAAYTGLSTATLEKLRCTGGGSRFVSYSRRAVRYRKVDLDEWMESRTVGSTSERKAA